MSTRHQPHGEETAIARTLIPVMAVASGVGVACIYTNQPLLGLFAASFPAHAALVGLVPTVTQLGYAAGLLLLVPLGDVVERRRLILAQFAVLALALAVVAAAPGPLFLLAASVLLGVAASVAQQVIPFAAALAAPERRGQVVGTVMSGLLAGILLGRVVSGIVAHHWGWRAAFGFDLLLVVATGVLLAATLPRRPPDTGTRYVALLASLAALWRNEPALRRATLTQTALFGSFIAFWTTLTLELDRDYGLGAQPAGLFGLLGVASVLLAPWAGRSADRRGPHAVIRFGAAAMLLAWLLFGLTHGIGLLVAGVLLLDIGEQGAMVSHQHVVYALRPEARARINTIFVGGMFVGSSIASAAATLAWNRGGWPAVCTLGGALSLLALWRTRRVSGAAEAAPHA